MLNVQLKPVIIHELSPEGDVTGSLFSVCVEVEGDSKFLGDFDSLTNLLDVFSSPEKAGEFLTTHLDEYHGEPYNITLF